MPDGSESTTTSVSKADLELARYLTLLEDMDLLLDLETIELMPLLEDADED